jgi:uncharacterized protein YkwD
MIPNMNFTLLAALSWILSIAFSDEDYQRYDYQQFAASELADQRIDLANIDYDLMHAAVFYATNEQRAAFKLKQFGFLGVLRDAARLHSTQMVELNFFNHINSRNPKLKTPLDRILASGGDRRQQGACAENIADTFLMDYKSGQSISVRRENGVIHYITESGDELRPHTYWSFARALVNQWMNSPGHRANILNLTYTHLGCGNFRSKTKDDFPMVKCTQIFCKLQN